MFRDRVQFAIFALAEWLMFWSPPSLNAVDGDGNGDDVNLDLRSLGFGIALVAHDVCPISWQRDGCWTFRIPLSHEGASCAIFAEITH